MKPTDDPQAVIAALLVTKRLINDGAEGFFPALEAAVTMSAAKDEERVWWACHHAVNSRLPEGMYNVFDLDRAYQLGAVTKEEMVDIVSNAAEAQSEINAALAKGKRPNGKGGRHRVSS